MATAHGDWCLIESDPGVFTELIRGFGMQIIENFVDNTQKIDITQKVWICRKHRTK